MSREAMKMALDWIAERPEDRKVSAGKMVAMLTEALAQPAQQLVPDGWQLVPKASTPEMIEAIANATGKGYGAAYRAGKAWAAALASAPPVHELPAQQPVSDERAEFESWAKQRDNTHSAKIVSDVLALGYPLGLLLWEAWQARAQKGTT